MTRSPAPNPGTGDNRKQEYIITEEQAEEYAKLYAEANTADFAPLTTVYGTAMRFLRALKTRPVAASQPTPEPHDIANANAPGILKQALANHDAAIRNKTISEIWEHIKSHCDPMTEDYFESLRTSSTADKGGE